MLVCGSCATEDAVCDANTKGKSGMQIRSGEVSLISVSRVRFGARNRIRACKRWKSEF